MTCSKSGATRRRRIGGDASWTRAAAAHATPSNRDPAAVPNGTDDDDGAADERTRHTLLFKSDRDDGGGAFLSNFFPHVRDRARRAAVRVYRVDARQGAFDAPMPMPVVGVGVSVGVGETTTFRNAEHYYQVAKYAVVDPAYASVVHAAAEAAEAEVGGNVGVRVKQAASVAAYAKWKARRTTHTHSMFGGGRRLTQAAAATQIRARLARFVRDVDGARAVMRRAVTHKFDATRNPSLASALVATHPLRLAEARSRQPYAPASPWNVTGVDGLGRNWLGDLLMQRRRALMTTPTPPTPTPPPPPSAATRSCTSM